MKNDEVVEPWTPEAFVGKRTRQLREARGWSQDELGRKLGDYGFAMHQTTVAKLENGTRPIRLNEVQALANIFGLTPSELFEESAPTEDSIRAVVLEVQRAGAAVAEAERRLHGARAEAKAATERVDAIRQELAEFQEQHAAASARAIEAAKAARAQIVWTPEGEILIDGAPSAAKAVQKRPAKAPKKASGGSSALARHKDRKDRSSVKESGRG